MRCAMQITVEPPNCVRIARCTAASSASSTADVASSNNRSFDRRRHARARHSNCRSPSEKFRPPSSTTASSGARSRSCASASARSTSASDAAPNGSTLNRTDPEKSTGSCGIMDTRRRRSDKRHASASTPSIKTFEPFAGGASRSSASKNDDLPEPVRPTSASFVPPSTVNDRPFSTRGSSGLYRSFRSRTSTRPADGHCSGAPHAPSSSARTPAWSTTRSTATELFSRSAFIRTNQFNDCVTDSAYVSDSPARFGCVFATTAKNAAAPVVSVPMNSRRTASHRLQAVPRKYARRFVRSFAAWSAEKRFSARNARIVDAPSNASANAPKTGDLDVASRRFSSRTDGMKYFIVAKYTSPSGATTAKNHGVANATVATVARQLIATDSHMAMVTGSSSSMV
mmetsp:Transcript_23709/g.71285  ORF Transcript_23709/g.71285 Transcript_23709/m.71285 type:complete len:399 (+) Transcript_23709:197-1393(+)